MKKFSIIIIALLATLMAAAQISYSNAGPEDQQAAALLKKAAARFDQNVAFDVQATFLDGQGKQKLRQSAHVLYCKGSYRVSLGDQEIVSDGRTVWQWNKANKEVMIENASTDDIDPMNPARLLKNYASAFRAKYIRTEEGGTAVVDLQPSAARSYHKIRLFITEQTGGLVRLEVHRYDASCMSCKGLRKPAPLLHSSPSTPLKSLALK